MNLIRNYLNEQLENPNDEFVKLILNHVYDGFKTKAVIDRFNPTVKHTFNLMMKDKVTDKLNAALNNTGASPKINITEDVENNEVKEEKTKNLPEITTTSEELEKYAIIKVSLNDVLPADRVYYRDNQSYFNILINDNNRKWIVRAYLGKNNNKIVLNNDEKTLINIEKPFDLLNHREIIISCVEKYK